MYCLRIGGGVVWVTAMDWRHGSQGTWLLFKGGEMKGVRVTVVPMVFFSIQLCRDSYRDLK